MTKFTASVLALTALLLPALAEEKPNFVIIFIDDMGYGDIEPFGSTVNKTPNLNRLAAEGMKLTSFYAAPVCSASRAQLLTGSYAPRVSVPSVYPPVAKNGLNPDEHTIADYLKELGYTTACVGKWHLGDQKDFLPTRHGFDSYFGIPYSNDMPLVSTETNKRVVPVLRDEEVAMLIEDEEQRLITRQYTEEAVKLIGTSAASGKPFFLYMPHSAVHTPIFPHPDFAGTSGNGRFGDWVAEVDWSVGEVLKSLDDNGLAENTVVVFTSDNGPWASKGTDGGVSGPLRGAKGSTLEGGVREPTIVRWPGKVAAGSESDAISGTPDLLPTFVSLAGGSLRENVTIDGFDLSSVLLGATDKTEREAWYYFGGYTLKAVRSGPWKLALTKQSIGMGLQEKPEDLQRGGRLYNLDEEIEEVTDLAAVHPDVVARLQKLADAMTLEMETAKRPAGLVENPVPLYPSLPRAKKKKGPSKPVNWKKLKNGSVLDPASVPDIAGKAFRIQCTVTTGEDPPEGVILAHGGSAVGYSLYAAGGKVIFTVRNNGRQMTRVETKFENGTSQISASLLKNGSTVLSVNNRQVSSVESSGLLHKHPQENFCVGHDDKNPVDESAPSGKFNGNISDISLMILK
ncbi:sulfatase [Verrucomicrobiales bacterium BCK34]|nr:sulfatase [Verrucomicrobiales bacterium BCK34]